jgi:hypothetical protein
VERPAWHFSGFCILQISGAGRGGTMTASRQTHDFCHDGKRLYTVKNDKARSRHDQALLSTKEGQRLGGHARAAGFFAATAGLGALLTMLHVGSVLLTLVAAGFTYFGAFFQQMRGVLRAPSHEAGRDSADIGAVAVDADAAGHHFYVFFLEAGRGAMLAGGDTGVEGVEQGLVLSVHGGRGYK